MRRADLEAHRWLVLQRRAAEQALLEQSTIVLGATNYDAMPRAGDASRVTENKSIALEMAFSEFARLDKAVSSSLDAGILSWVSAIEDIRVKMIIVLYFLEGNTWQEVARRMGGGNTEEGVKAVFYRFLPPDD